MRNKIFLVLLLFMITFSSANINNIQTSNPSLNNLYSSSDIATYWPSLSNNLGNQKCEAGSDFLVAIPIDGCSPSIVRSDLLSEQNVPVFCKLKAVNVNPLIDVSKIDSISFKGDYPEDVVSVSYHPAKAAIKSNRNALLGSPVVNDIGYVVIVLKKQANESAIKKWVSGNLTATMRYKASDAYGVGQSAFYLNSVSDSSWEENYVDNSFWNGKGYLRLDDMDDNSASIAIYTDKDEEYTQVRLKEGETSGNIYLPGSYCRSTLKVKLNSIVSDEDSAQLDIDGNSVWVRQGTKFLNDACVVNSLNVGYGGAGTLTFKCQNSKSVTLSLTSRDLVNISNKQYILGDFVEKRGDKNYYLGYVGGAGSDLFENGKVSVEKGTNFIVLVSEKTNTLVLDNSKVIKLANAISVFFNTKNVGLEKASLESKIKSVASDAIILYGVAGENDVFNFQGVADKTISADSGNTVSDVVRDEIRTYYDKMDSAQNELTDLYPWERGGEIFGVKAFSLQVPLLQSMSNMWISNPGAVTELMERAKKIYSDSQNFGVIKQSSKYDYSNAISSVYVNNEYKRISLAEVRGADKSAESARFSHGGSYLEVHEGETVETGEAGKSDYFIIKEIQRNFVTVAYYKYQGGSETTSIYRYQASYTIKEDAEQKIKRTATADADVLYTLRVSDISVVDVASVSLISEIATSSGANFTYKIGIEKRAIQLSPEKARDMADNLNDTINKWEKRNAQLGKLVKTWNTACLVTSAALQVKTLLNGFGGASTVRKEVMSLYKKECNTEELNDLTSTKCYASLNKDGAIDKDVEAYADAIKKVNEEIQGKNISGYQNSAGCGSSVIYTSTNKVVVNCSDLNSWAEIKAYLLNKHIGQSSSASDKLKASTKGDFETKMEVVAQNKNAVADQDAANKLAIARNGPNAPKYVTYTTTVSDTVSWTGSRAKDIKDGTKTNDINSTCNRGSAVTDNSPIQYVNSNNKNYLLVLDEGLIKKPICILEITIIEDNVESYSLVERISSVNAVDNVVYNSLNNLGFVSGFTGTCNKGYRENTEFKVEFYEYGNNKGNPAKVPFDKKGGWYVKVSSSTGSAISDKVKSYDDSGAVTNYQICNVGEDGSEDGKDSCDSFNINSGVSGRESVAGCRLSESEIKKLAMDAQLAIKQAQQNYGKKSFHITVRGDIEVTGSEAVSDLGYECEDFMSLSDCHIMYNVCDPVVCPSSRCDMGGRMKVANVIQSGIIGSIALCLPNFGSPSEGGVIVPVCLSGLHAGIDGWISILKSEQKCLIEAAETGSYTGICDEITAVYKCEFFWRQLSPLMDNIVPALAESLMGGSKDKGGGEYLTFQDSWNNMQGSIDYFKNTYASNSFRALQFGNVEEFGTEVCQNFIGTSVPSSADVLDSLTDPVSPYQFYAKFSELEFTSATVPATSQYNVYYHIYAGNDKGVSYQVYLKDPVELSYVSVPATVHIATGFVGVGEEVDETKKTTAPAGYKQLCVTIDGVTECGFKSVTTDVGLDMLHDAYVKDVVNSSSDITTEKDCINGQSSLYSLLNLNLEEGIDETINPDIALSGIVRVCSTSNPGSSATDPNWRNVGYCGKTNLICWLDEASLKKGVYEILEKTRSVADTNEILSSDGDLTHEESEALLEKIQKNITELDTDLAVIVADAGKNTLTDESKKKISEIDDLIENASLSSNTQKAKLIYLKFELYHKVVNFLINKVSDGNFGDGKNDVPKVAEAVKTVNVASEPTAKNDMVVSNSDTSIEKYSLDYNGYVLDVDGNALTSSNGAIYFKLGYEIRKRGVGLQSESVAKIDKQTGYITISKALDTSDMDALAPIAKYKVVNDELILRN